MNKILNFGVIGFFAFAIGTNQTAAQTDGSARLQATILDYNGSSTKHYTVVWVTTESGTFIKTLRKQGPSSWTSSQWNAHCTTWNTARAGSTALDGYTSATAANYTGTNSPIYLTWNGRNANNQLVPDGRYKFWIQYAEDQSSQGPVTTGGLIWTKGPASATTTYPNQGANFSAMSVEWSPALPPVEPPLITSAKPPSTGTVGTPYQHTATSTGTAPITYSASGLPLGLIMSTNGIISGIPTTAGSFNGTITASNGTAPNATQSFDITIDLVPLNIVSIQYNSGILVLNGNGPANGIYYLLTSPNLLLLPSEWTPVTTNTFDSNGRFSFTNTLNINQGSRFYQLRLP